MRAAALEWNLFDGRDLDVSDMVQVVRRTLASWTHLVVNELSVCELAQVLVHGTRHRVVEEPVDSIICLADLRPDAYDRCGNGCKRTNDGGNELAVNGLPHRIYGSVIEMYPSSDDEHAGAHGTLPFDP